MAPWTLPPPRRLRDVGVLAEFEILARKRLPRAIFGFVRAGVEADAGYEASLDSWRDWCIVPHILQGSAAPDIAVTLLGRTYAAPFGIAPMGGAALGRFRGDLEFARAAAAENVPFLISGASAVPMEALHDACPQAWMQIYMPGDRAGAEAIAGRIERAGFETLVVTVDVPVGSNRIHYDRLGFSQPLRIGRRLLLDALLHPRWLAAVAARTLLADGVPHYENSGPVRGGPIVTASPVAYRRAKLGWDDLAAIRDRWPGKLVVKGVLALADAVRAAVIGIDGIIVSGHGGRQLDSAIAPLRALPAIVAGAPGLEIMIDGGLRWGGDVMKAFALGARFAFIGRPFYFANAVGGCAALRQGISLLKAEIVRNMAMAGADSMAQLDRSFLAPAR